MIYKVFPQIWHSLYSFIDLMISGSRDSKKKWHQVVFNTAVQNLKAGIIITKKTIKFCTGFLYGAQTEKFCLWQK